MEVFGAVGDIQMSLHGCPCQNRIGKKVNDMRLIDADALIDKYGDWYTEEGTEEGYIGMIKGIVDSMPTIEPERKKGKWIPAFDGKFRGGAYWFNCSECNHMVVGGLGYGNFFCENCGADMREGSEQA